MFIYLRKRIFKKMSNEMLYIVIKYYFNVKYYIVIFYYVIIVKKSVYKYLKKLCFLCDFLMYWFNLLLLK